MTGRLWPCDGSGRAVTALAAGAMSLLAARALAQPVNDACTNAIDISAGGTFTGSLVGATETPGVVDCRGASGGADVWFRINGMGCGGAFSLNTCGSDFAGIVDVFSGPCGGPLTRVACTSDGSHGPCPGTYGVYMAVSGAFGTAYRVRLSNFNLSATGHYVLNVGCCAGDINADGYVTIADFLLYLQIFSQGAARADLNGDGVVNLQDFLAYLQAYGHNC
jgi:hypothetical protein